MAARTRFPDAYLKGANKWWDGYNLQDTVLLEELGYTDDKGTQRSQISAYHLKLWADHWPFTAEAKGSTVQIRPKRLIVTSNYHPSDLWKAPEDLDPILRRFKVHHYTEPYKPSSAGAIIDASDSES